MISRKLQHDFNSILLDIKAARKYTLDNQLDLVEIRTKWAVEDTIKLVREGRRILNRIPFYGNPT